MDHSPNLSLPLIAGQQAQKHITHNEALRVLDALVQLGVLSASIATPPEDPAEGDRYIVPAGAAGAWAGHEGDVAAHAFGAWSFYPPVEGWWAHVADTDRFVHWSDGAWADASGALVNPAAMVGVNATADSANRLSVTSPAALFNAETDDMRVTLNKAAEGDTASVVFQTGWSGRAEFGTTGDDDFHVKVSADGAVWKEAMVIAAADGSLRLPEGTTSAPSLRIGDADTGLSRSAGALHTSVDGTEVVRFGGTGLGVGGGFAPTELLHVRRIGGSPTRLVMQGEGGVNNQVERYSNDATGPFFQMRKARGSIASPVTPSQNDVIGSIAWYLLDPTNPRGVAEIRAQVTAATPSPTDAQGRVLMMVSAAGSASPSEILRLEHATGLSLFGANVVVDQNRVFRLRDYTLAGLPAASTAAGQMVHCSELGGGGGLLVSDGTAWRRAQPGLQTISSDADLTLNPLANAEHVLHTGTLSAIRSVTLATTHAYPGARFRISRSGGGAFALNVGSGPLEALATGTWAEVVYDGSAWRLAASGSL